MSEAEKDSSIQSAFQNVVDTSQRLLLDRLDLFQLEVKGLIQRVSRSLLALIGAGVFFLLCWISFMLALFSILQTKLSPWLSWCMIAFLQGVIAGMFILLANRMGRMKKEEK